MPRLTSLLWRRLASPALLTSMAIVVLSVAMVWAFTRFGMALETSLTRDSARLLGGDLVLRARAPQDLAKVLHTEFGNAAELSADTGAQARLSWGIEFLTTTSNQSPGGEPRWSTVSVRSIDTAYPLYDPIELESGAVQKLAPGEVWIDRRVLAELGLQLGDELRIGAARMKVAGIIAREPDRMSSGFAGLTARVIMHLEDVAKTGMLVPGSVATYRVSLRGEPEVITAIESAALADDIRAVRPGEAGMGSSGRVALRFFPMVSTFVLLIGTIALVMVARRFARQEQRIVSLMRMLGASRKSVRSVYLMQLAGFFALALMLGFALGFALETLIAQMAASVVDLEGIDTSQGISSAAVALLISLTTLAVLPWPYLTAILRSEPLLLLRNTNEEHVDMRHIAIWALSALAYLFAVVVLLTDAWTALAVLCILVFSLLIGYGCIALIGAIQKKSTGAGPLQLAIGSIRSRARESVLLIAVLATILTSGQTVSVIGEAFVRSWQSAMPENIPDWFVINIPEWEIAELQTALDSLDAEISPFMPRAGAKIMDISSQTPATDYQAAEIEEDKGRDINFTWSYNLPPDNELTAGDWWQKNEAGDTGDAQLLSITENVAMDYGLEPGDTIELELDTGPAVLTVHNIRRVNWSAFSPNFQFVLHPQAARDIAGTYLTSFTLPRSSEQQFLQLVGDFSGVVFISVGEVANQAAEYVRLLISGVRSVILLLVPMAILLMVAAIWASMSERHSLIALMRVFGANRMLCLKIQFYEFMIIGVSAGLTSLAVVEVALAVLRNLGGEFARVAGNADWVLFAPLTGALMAFGVLPTVFSATRRSPAQVFRSARYV